MSRIPASATIVLAGLLPACAVALGLGEIESKSFLNQPLAAEIPVISDSPGELAGLNVALASPETFAQYGLTRPAMLADLRFAVVPGPRGGAIQVSSDQPVTEPFVTMLLEVRWAQGRLLREYTVLLDPPAFATGAVRQPVPQPVREPVAPAMPAAAIAREPGPESQPAAAAPANGGERTHTVARNETLWGIADEYRPSRSTDINRAMMSIYRANPEAFAGNINRLRAGAVLRIPAAAEMERVGRGEADAEVQRQNREWRGGSPAAVEAPARLELVPPPEAAAPAPPAGAAPAAPAVQAQLEESRRLLAVKDAELKALREQVAALEQKAGAVPPEPEAAPAPVPEQPAVAPPPAEEAAPQAAEPAPKVPPAAKAPRAEQGSGILGAIGSVLTSIWFWLAAAAVLVGAALLARRRAAGEPEPWQPPAAAANRGAGAATVRGRGDQDILVVEEPAQATGGFERRAVARGDEELPLERTISTEGSVNLDQDDPLAEADFHMAYGLYDQAADLLTAALAREPGRRDLQLKLLDVYFVWENREGFMKQARALRERVGSDTDPDWKRVVIMGKQLCGSEPLFAGAAAQAAVDMDLGMSADSTGALDFEIGGGDAGLDLEFGDDLAAGTAGSPSTRVARPSWAAGQTQEIPTIEAPGVDTGATMETPTVESPTLTSTLETPTIETPVGERTQETPTLQTMTPGAATTAKLRAAGLGDERSDQTAEIDLDELGLDLTGLDEAARDMATGLQEVLPEDSSALDFDLSAGGDLAEGEESTAEMEKGPGLSHITNAMGKSETGVKLAAPPAEDTVEQPGADNSMMTRGISATSDELEALNIDLDFGSADSAQSDLTATGLRTIGVRGPDDATMTEVGTKLDLARAYLDMGDPDGARSILNEVLEEGDQPQRQEARQLLDSLDR